MLQSQNRPGDFIQAHLTNDAGCHAQRIEGIRGIEARNKFEGIAGNMRLWVNAAAGQQHIGDAALKRLLKYRSDPFCIQRLQIAPGLVVEKLSQVVPKIGRHRIGSRAEKHRRKAGLIRYRSKFLLQRTKNRRFIFRLHLPDRNRSGVSSGVGI